MDAEVADVVDVVGVVEDVGKQWIAENAQCLLQ